MGGFYSEEYKHLLEAQRVLAGCMARPNIEPRDAAMVASALTRTIDQKRVMRGQPAPKPSDNPKARGKVRPPLPASILALDYIDVDPALTKPSQPIDQ